MNAVSVSATLCQTRQVAPDWLARAHPAFQAATRAALGSRFPADVMLAVADAVAELLPHLPAEAPPGELAPAYRAEVLAEALRHAAGRMDAATPRVPPDPGLPDGCQAVALATAARGSEAGLARVLGTYQARQIVAAMEVAASAGDAYRIMRAAEVAIALENSGLGRPAAAALYGAISGSPLIRELRIGTVLRLLHDAGECMA